MDFQAKSLKTEKVLLIPVVLVSLAFLVVFGIINFIGFEQFCVPDMYADTLVAKLIWDGKTLFPRGFVFGNQLYVVATPVLSALFYGLTGSPNTGMALATTAMSIFIMLSFAWMLRPFLKNSLSICCAVLMLLSCVFGKELIKQETGQLFFTMCSFYACYLVTLFVVLGDYIRAIKGEGIRPAALILSLLLCFATGMQSLRQTCVMVLPILAFEFLRLATGRLKDKAAFSLRPSSASFRAMAYAVFNLAGYFFSKLLNVHQYTIFEEPSHELSQRFTDIFNACREISGFGWAKPEYPFFILMFVFQVGLLVFALYLQLKKPRAGFRGLSALWWLLLISILAVIAAGLFTSVTIRGIYLFTYYPLLALSLVLVLERVSPKGKAALVLILCLLAAGNLYFSYSDAVDQSIEQPDSPHAQICRWAVENGYELVYGSHSNAAPGVAVYSDGALISGSWNDEIMFKAQEYINLQNIYSLEDVDRAVFVFMPWELEYAHEAAQVAGAELTFIGQYGDMYLYTSTVQLMYPRTYPWHEW